MIIDKEVLIKDLQSMRNQTAQLTLNIANMEKSIDVNTKALESERIALSEVEGIIKYISQRIQVMEKGEQAEQAELQAIESE